MSEEHLRGEAERQLRALAGEHARLRDDQWRAIASLVTQRRRVLVVQRTGWGKSAVYFVATALLRATGAGPTLIVSPLLALMRNQIAAAERAGIRARTINSANVAQWAAIHEEVTAGRVDVLLVSPERLNNPEFRDTVLPTLAAETGLLVVDEAHCISDWGHDFRPDYRRIRTLLEGLRPEVPVLATTATANSRVAADVAEQLGDALVLRGSLDRESLRLRVLRLPSAAHRLGWLAEHLAELPGSGIIYTLTVAQADDVATFLRDRGHEVLAYSGRSEDSERQAAEADLLANRVKAVVATSALGMGFDKPDLGFVVHVGAPQSPIAYYQQVGRAGRGLDRAEVLLLPGAEDEDIWRYYAGLAFPAQEQVQRTLEVLTAAGRALSTGALEAKVELRRTRLEMMLKVLDVEGAVRRVRGGWVATGEPWSYDSARYTRVAAARATEQQAMRDYIHTTGCRMEFLRRQLDDPDAARCGRCDNCAGDVLDAEVSVTALAASRADLNRAGVPIEARQLWPTGLVGVGVGLTGRIPPAERSATGRVIGRLSDIGWGPRLRGVLAAEDATIPEDIFTGVVEVLRHWGWETRPVAVIAVGSATRPVLVTSLAQRLAAVGRLEWLGTIERSGGAHRGVARTNSAQRVRLLHGAYRLTAEQQQAVARLAGPVLLVDDYIDTGWTVALVSRDLRQAGAPAVLPFALALQG